MQIPKAERLHPDAIYRLNIDNDGDCLTDIAFSYVFSPAANGRQTSTSSWPRARNPARPKPVGTKIVADAEVSFGPKPNIVKVRQLHLLRRQPQRRFLLRLRRNQELFDTTGGRNFTAPHLGGKSPWTGVDSNTESQRLLDGDRAADERTRRQAGDPHLGAMQRRTRRQAPPRRSGRPSVGQQLLQHRRHQGGIQRQRAGQRSQALARNSSST